MKNKGLLIIVIIFVILIFASIFAFNNKKLKVSEVEKYFQEETTIYNDELGERLISILPKAEREKIEKRTGEIENVKIMKEKALFGDKDCIILFFTKEYSSFILVYEKNMLEYKSLGLLDVFSEVMDIQFIKLKKENSNIIFVREVIDYLDLSYEKGTFIKGYYYDDSFSLVLSLTEEYEINSNNIVDRWKKVYEKSDIKFTNEYYPIIEVLEQRVDFVSEITSQKHLPERDKFDVINSKNILTKYSWSNEYKHFIIGKGIDRRTGSKVAIVEDLHFESYFNMNEIDDMREKYIIKYKDGLLKVVPHSDIEISEETYPLKLVN